MNVFKKIYCRVFQLGMRIALPFLPYREPKLIEGVSGVPAVLREHGIDCVMLVTDAGVHGLGLTARLEETLKAQHIRCVVYDRTVANPTVANVEEARALYLEQGCQGLIAFGGGSSMDCAKAVGARIVRPRKSLDKMEGLLHVMHRLPLLIAVPTTAGTGSETTLAAVITDEKTGTKYPLADYELMPDVAIVDADLMMSIPKGLTSCSGIDAMSHALEAIASVMATDFTNGIAKEAARIIFEYLPRAYEKGAHDAEARERMANASCMAGMAFANAFLGVCHSMAHKLGAYHHLPHGVANALLIELIMRYNADPAPVKMGTFSQYPYPHAKERYCEVARFVGIQGKNDDEVFENFIKAIADLKATVGIKRTIKDYGIKEEDFLATLDEMVENAFNDQCTGANPRYPLMSEIKEIYLKAYYEG